jgi:hypothetical protein
LKSLPRCQVDCIALYPYGARTDCTLEVETDDNPSYPYEAATDDAEDVVKLPLVGSTSADVAEVVSDSYPYGVGSDEVLTALDVVDSDW